MNFDILKSIHSPLNLPLSGYLRYILRVLYLVSPYTSPIAIPVFQYDDLYTGPVYLRTFIRVLVVPILVFVLRDLLWLRTRTAVPSSAPTSKMIQIKCITVLL